MDRRNHRSPALRRSSSCTSEDTAAFSAHDEDVAEAIARDAQEKFQRRAFFGTALLALGIILLTVARMKQTKVAVAFGELTLLLLCAAKFPHEIGEGCGFSQYSLGWICMVYVAAITPPMLRVIHAAEHPCWYVVIPGTVFCYAVILVSAAFCAVDIRRAWKYWRVACLLAGLTQLSKVLAQVHVVALTRAISDDPGLREWAATCGAHPTYAPGDSPLWAALCSGITVTAASFILTPAFRSRLSELRWAASPAEALRITLGAVPTEHLDDLLCCCPSGARVGATTRQGTVMSSPSDSVPPAVGSEEDPALLIESLVANVPELRPPDAASCVVSWSEARSSGLEGEGDDFPSDARSNASEETTDLHVPTLHPR
mmetsp:Transcript_28927/g.49421  ORF Transcript_28927/g.49421 Transcript_28927/m.49421 type:complete len:372 (+) Transcript_28927:31-1146(+)